MGGAEEKTRMDAYVAACARRFKIASVVLGTHAGLAALGFVILAGVWPPAIELLLYSLGFVLSVLWAVGILTCCVWLMRGGKPLDDS